MFQPRTESVRRRLSVFFVIISLLVSFGGPVAPAIAANGTALDLGSAGSYVTFGDPAKLDLPVFTIETWFKRTGPGVASTTGTGGITSFIPLLTHGAAEADGSNVDANWLLGINTSGVNPVIAADFEGIDDPADPLTGQNAPISGTTAITLNVWHHAAATFDGATWAVYLDGNLEASSTPGFHPRSDSIQRVALGAMLPSGIVAPTAGRFQGVLDEARVWSVAHTQLQIQATKNSELTSGTGLVARWGLNEGTSTVVGDSLGTPANGTVTGTGFSWVPGFVVPGTPIAIADSYTTPQDTALNVSAPGVLANDTDNGPITAVLVTNVTHGSLTLNADGSFGYTPNASYVGADSFTYKANDGSLDSDPVTASIGVGNNALQFDGTNDYVTFGAAPSLGVTTFTLETWFKRTGAGAGTGTGNGGLASAVPLITKGRAEQETPANLNMNYFLGIDTATNTLVADFEDTATGLNHPTPASATVITSNVWHHAAATYDGSTWRLYLDGVLDQTFVVGAFTPESTSIQHAGIGTAMTSTGVAAGFFQGVLDEVRIWNVARSGPQILASKNSELTSGSGLIARWGINEGTGTAVNNSIGGGVNGTATNGPTWVPGFVPPAAGNTAPNAPTLNAPANGATGIGTSPTLDVGVSDPDSDPLTVTFFGRPLASGNFVQIAQHTGIGSGTNDTAAWASLGAGQTFEWYATVNDGSLTTTGPTWTFHTVASSDPVFVGAGDIADCGRTQDEATGAMIAGIDGAVWTAGDNVYPTGTDINNYNNCYAPGWGGAIKARTRPVPGNHDWGTGQVPSGSETLAAYNSYFGSAATDANGKSYYSYDIPSSNWHVVNLDTECQLVVGGCDAGSPQELWLKSDLAANGSKNVIAVWHKPRFSSGVTNYTTLQAFYQDIYDAGADILLDGHDHIYERLAPMDPTGAADPTYGIRQFTVGTGGAALQSYSPVLPTSQTGSGSTFGVLKLTLHATTYDWSFLPMAGQTFTDSGSGSVHAAPPDTNNAPVALADAYSTPLNTALNVAAPGVLGNDTDADADTLTAVLDTTTTHGSLTLNPDGDFLYTPNGGYNGPDSFTYHANDGTADSNSVTVSLTVGAPVNTALDLGGTSYVTFGDPDKLDLGQFTIETWFMRTGVGTPNTTGTGGITIVPLVTHGAPEADGSNVDANWILGINTTGNVIAADFEASPGGQNYPVSGSTPITNNVWHHAAATYDGTVWHLYLDGNLETPSCPTTCSPGVAPRLDSIQQVGLGAMLTSTGTAIGRFDGVIDEARVWDHARLGSEILADKNSELTVGTGLMARWGLNEGTGTIVGDSMTTPANGTVTGTGSAWVPGFVPPAAGNTAPNAPTLNAPANGATGIGTSPTLDVGVSDPDSDPLTVTFFGRPLASGNFVQIAQHTGIGSGTNDTAAWASLGAGQTFEWYATVNDGSLTTTGPTWTFHTVASTDPVFVGVGDIGSCSVTTDTDTGNLIAGVDGAIWTTGDNVYPNGTATDFANCYEPTPWGSTPVQSRTRPIPGNHDWGTGVTDNLDGYFGYYGAAATDANGKSYYSYNINSSWHVVNLDSECQQALLGGCGVGSAQEVWLKADLAANSTKNVIALWHKPRYSSGATNLQVLQPLWDDLYAAGADILLDGHDHIYERFVPMKSGATLSDPPVADPTYGIQQFTVGTGGEAHHSLGTTLATSVVRNNTDFGIMKLTLHATSYDWVFLPIAGSTFTDSGTGTVHAAPANTAPVASADSYTTSFNTPLNVSAPGVLTNDTDADGNSLTAVLNVNVTHGSLTLNANGSFSYTPNSGYSGPDSFTYHANDGAADSNVVTVSLTVTTIPAGLVGYWTMDQTSGTLAPDTGLAPANNASTVGGPTWVTGKIGNALQLNGTTQDATTPDEASLDITSAITIAAWIKPEKVGSSNIPQLLVQKATIGATSGYELGLTGATSTAPQKAYIRFNEATNFDTYRVTSTSLYPTNGTTWIHVAGTWDGTTIRFYYNGVEQGTPVAFAGPIAANNLAVGIGGPPTFDAARLFKGAMDDVRLYNRALSASEIAALAAPNAAPVANNGAFSIPAGASTGGTLGASDTDGNPLTFSVVSLPTKGTLSLNNATTGAYSYTASPSATGTDSFTFKANDGFVDSNVATITVTLLPGQGYWLVASDGGIFTFGTAGFFGSTGGHVLDQPVVSMAPTPTKQGYWLVAADGGIFTFGDAGFFGSHGGTGLTNVVGMAATPTGLGYWLAGSDGEVYVYGDAVSYGSMGGQTLDQPIVGMAATPSGHGYWLVASDGGIFAFGDAGFFGSTGGQLLDQPVVGMTPTASGNGYWLVASDGGIFAFGDAGFHGSKGGQPLDQPVVGMTATPSGNGYWLVASDGGIFTFGDAGFYGSEGGQPLFEPVVGMAGR